eukprot:CAMPEP_0114521066 /NCGR_PEP_ID=MMETSP0109-20121206/19977_1 /TAXON_ID=29199 /ORGANISM="Chlorarachnion reptans, Strain CCCM449" /LENGTH=620 /DNA_ID=CAMNT_0001702125 /DNA_START=109 /DNA_END=1971 /DNA_ORIENTATION=+
MASAMPAAAASRLALLSDHTVPLLLTAGVAILLVGLFKWLADKLSPSGSTSSSPRRSSDAPPSHTTLLTEYGRAWSLHQLIPFIDQLLFNSYGQAMDNRMIVPLDKGPIDWLVRLPLSCLCMLWPSSPSLLVLAHLVNVISWATWMPAVWDHMVWAALLEVTFLAAFVFRCGGSSLAACTERFVAAARAQLVVLYLSAAFWKLTTSWYALYTSCAPVLLSELLSALFTREVLPPGGAAANALLSISPIFVAGLEFAVAGALCLFPSGGVLLALVFHQTINLMPMTYAGGFSSAMCCRFVLFLPGAVSASLRLPGHYIAPGALVAAIGAVMYTVHGWLDTAAVAFLGLAFLYVRAVLSGAAKRVPRVRSSKALILFAVAVGTLYGFATPILGLQAMASSTMYGNLRQFGGGNHLLVRTGVLQDYYSAKGNGPSWAADAFGGGMVRVDSTNSSVFQQLNPADATGQLPPFAREMLRGLGASARYFELYAARNYFGRTKDLEASALHNRGKLARSGDPPYAQPAYELRRVLDLARKHGESFSLVYTKLPYYGNPRTYRNFEGVQVRFEENSGTGVRTCTVGSEPCADDEIALQPPPPRWLLWMFHPYPMPLLEGDSEEVHCST